MNLVVVAASAALACIAGAFTPAVVRRLPEPPPQPGPPGQPGQPGQEDELAAETVTDPVGETVAAPEGASRRRPRRPVPDFSLWGMHAREREKEPYRDLAAVPHLALGCAIACAVLGLLVGWKIGWHPALAVVLPVVPVGVAVAVIDWRTRLIPSRLVLPATAYVVVAGLVIWGVTGDRADLVRAVVGLVVVRSIFWVLWFIRAAGMGFGDVRLSALIGFVLGYASAGALFFGVWIGFFAFVLPGVVLAIVKRTYQLMRVPFPFGPFMLIGAVLGILVGQPVMVALTG